MIIEVARVQSSIVFRQEEEEEWKRDCYFTSFFFFFFFFFFCKSAEGIKPRERRDGCLSCFTTAEMKWMN